MLMHNYLIYAGINTLDYGIRINGKRTYGAPERDETMVSVPGKNGDVVLDNGRWLNRVVSYDCSIARDFRHRFDSFRQAVMAAHGYQRMEDTYHQDEFYLARLSGALEPNVSMQLDAGTFTLTFDRKPQRYLKSGELEVEGASPIDMYNPTLYASRPLIRVNCGSTDSLKLLSVGHPATSTMLVVYPYPVLDEALSAEDFAAALATGLYVDIDCDIGEAYGVYYSGGVATTINLNAAISLSTGSGFPSLMPGENHISTTGDGLAVTPRWYTI